jgi:hypothetical protein
MKKIVSILMCLIMVVVMFGCSDNLTIDNVTYETYGLINQDDNKAEYIKYKPCWGNIIWGVVLFETVIAPIYFFGFDMFEPVGYKLDYKK